METNKSFEVNQNGIITNPEEVEVINDGPTHFAKVSWGLHDGKFFFATHYYFRSCGGRGYGVSIKRDPFDTFDAMWGAAITELIENIDDKQIKKKLFPNLQLNLFHE